MKLSELVTEENMGKVRVRDPNWSAGKYYTPIFKDKHDHYLGLDENDSYCVGNGNWNGWELYTEPPKTKKVVLYQWWHTAIGLSPHSTEEQFLVMGLKPHEWTKIESTRLEIEVPE